MEYNFQNGFLPETNNKDLFIKELKNRIDYLQHIYNNTDEELVDDEQFDALLKYYNDLTGNEYLPNGAKSSDDDPKLPCYAPSLTKLKDEKFDKQLTLFLSRYEGNLVLMDKYDGISVIVEYNNGSITCQKRGNGIKGPNISFITKYGNQFPNLSYNIMLRGEYILFDSDFEELKPYLIANGQKANNTRSVVNGATSRVNPNPTVLDKCKFIPYSLYIKDRPISQSSQLESLKQLGFNVPQYNIITKQQCTKNILLDYLKQRREQIPYRIDGLVLIFDIPVTSPINSDPQAHATAVKQDTIGFTTIRNCEWGITSKDGYLTPVIQVDPIVIITTVTNITLSNARMIYNNKLSPGTKIAITQGGDIIPKFLWTVSEGNGMIFCPQVPYVWKENSKGDYVEIMIANPDSYPQIKCCKLKYFLDILGIKKWGLLTIWKLYHSGLTNLAKLIRVTIEELILAEGIQERGAKGLIDELHKGISNANMAKIMAGSCIFGEGLSEGVLQKFITQIPNWRYSHVTYEQILNLKDFGPSRATKIYEKLPEFIQWLNGMPELEGLTIKQISMKSSKFSGYIFYFTGFTDPILKQEVESNGGKVEENYVKSVNIVVRKDANFTKSVKVTDALNSGGKIRLITRAELDQELRNMRLSN